MILKPSILSKFVKANINTHRRTEGGATVLRPPSPGQGPEGAMARGGGQGREIISRLWITITQETFENMYVFFLIGGGGYEGREKPLSISFFSY